MKRFLVLENTVLVSGVVKGNHIKRYQVAHAPSEEDLVLQLNKAIETAKSDDKIEMISFEILGEIALLGVNYFDTISYQKEVLDLDEQDV